MVNANWDVDELKAEAAEISWSTLLESSFVGYPFPGVESERMNLLVETKALIRLSWEAVSSVLISGTS